MRRPTRVERLDIEDCPPGKNIKEAFDHLDNCRKIEPEGVSAGAIGDVRKCKHGFTQIRAELPDHLKYRNELPAYLQYSDFKNEWWETLHPLLYRKRHTAAQAKLATTGDNVKNDKEQPTEATAPQPEFRTVCFECRTGCTGSREARERFMLKHTMETCHDGYETETAGKDADLPTNTRRSMAGLPPAAEPLDIVAISCRTCGDHIRAPRYHCKEWADRHAKSHGHLAFRTTNGADEYEQDIEVDVAPAQWFTKVDNTKLRILEPTLDDREQELRVAGEQYREALRDIDRSRAAEQRFKDDRKAQRVETRRHAIRAADLEEQILKLIREQG